MGFECSEAPSGEAGLALLENQPVHMILCDMVMPQMTGLDFLGRVKKILPRTEVALMTGHGSVETAVQAMRLGAYDYITKPFTPLEELRLFLRRMADKVQLVEENEFLRERTDTETELHGIIGASPKIQDVLRMISRLKDTRTPVLITGESGTGKELVARAIHFRGGFASQPFVAVDCGSLVPTLIESELFGHEKGAFTGAVRSKPGLFHAASGGTIFLDEIGELPLELQAKLLRVLQDKEVRPVGGNNRAKVDVRVVAATNRDLEAAYKDGGFRKDLYFRLNVVTVHLPALRERRADIPMLVHWFIDRYAPGSGLQSSRYLRSASCDSRIRSGDGFARRWVRLQLYVLGFGGHRTGNHPAGLPRGSRRQGAGRQDARHQSRYPVSKAEALQHSGPKPDGNCACGNAPLNRTVELTAACFRRRSLTIRPVVSVLR